MKNSGITDLRVIAIGYSATDRYYSFYTTNGKLDFKGKFEDLKGTGIPEDENVLTHDEALDAFIQELKKGATKIKEDLSSSPDARAFRKALSYPFRTGATKTILAVRSNGIPYSLDPVRRFFLLIFGVVF